MVKYTTEGLKNRSHFYCWLGLPLKCSQTHTSAAYLAVLHCVRGCNRTGVPTWKVSAVKCDTPTHYGLSWILRGCWTAAQIKRIKNENTNTWCMTSEQSFPVVCLFCSCESNNFLFLFNLKLFRLPVCYNHSFFHSSWDHPFSHIFSPHTGTCAYIADVSLPPSPITQSLNHARVRGKKHVLLITMTWSSFSRLMSTLKQKPLLTSYTVLFICRV